MSYGQSYNNYPAYGEAQSNPYAGNQGYGQNQYGYGNQDVEMNPMQRQPADPNVLLNEIQKVKEGIESLQNLREGQLSAAQRSYLQSSSTQEDDNNRRILDQIEGEVRDGFQKVYHDISRIKKTPGSANVQGQLERQTRAVRTEFELLQKDQMNFQRQLRDQIGRRIKIADETISDEELERQTEAVIAGQQQTFQVAGARSQRANDVKNAVLSRSGRIKNIEALMTELLSIVQHLGQEVEQQAPAVEQIDQGAENVAQDLGNANTQLGQAVESARKARRWKWYALIIVIIIIAIIVAVAVGVTQSRN